LCFRGFIAIACSSSRDLGLKPISGRVKKAANTDDATRVRVVRRFKKNRGRPKCSKLMPARLAAALEIADISGACDRRRRALIVATGARSVIPSRSIEHVGPP
jgi:myo-inositol catabolism protein IolC